MAGRQSMAASVGAGPTTAPQVIGAASGGVVAGTVVTGVAPAAARGRRVPVAAFDFDGTCIAGQSGALITLYLLRHGLLDPRAAVALPWWGARYKLHLPHRQEEARELVVGSLAHRRPSEVAAIMAAFHDEVLVPRYRAAAVREVARRRAEGCATLLVSATFAEVADAAARSLGVDATLATHMERDAAGRYTGRVEGAVVAGHEKVAAVVRWADATLGIGRWYLAAAYGDHYSDVPLLAAAVEPVAVCPTRTLATEARRRGWLRVDWSQGPAHPGGA